MQKNYIVHKGVRYFKSYEAARAYVRHEGLRTDRIIPYILGWAIQLEVSGPYA